MKKKKGFTLVELLVVIAIIALLMGILMPALARVRQIAYRLYCGTNLSGIGKAMLIYGNDYDDEMPRAGVVTGTGPSQWFNQISNWRNVPRAVAFQSNTATISSSFYLLVKYAEVTPKSFLCKGDSGATEFVPMDEPGTKPLPSDELVDFWDFGVQGLTHCSYSYHMPYGSFGLTSSSEPGMAVAADPNPWLGTGDATRRNPGQQGNNKDDFVAYKTGMLTGNPTKEQIEKGNSLMHQEDGQNVLFMDGHTYFEKNSACGIDEDNIYTRWDPGVTPLGADKKTGLVPIFTAIGGESPTSRTDSFLVGDNKTRQ